MMHFDRKVVRIAQKSLRGGLLALLAVAMIANVGCSWFTKKKPQVEPQPPAQVSAPAQPQPAGPPASAPAEGLRPGDLIPFPEMKTIYFDFDRSDIRPDQLPILEENLKFLVAPANAAIKFAVIGHCDERGTTEYNYLLGERRANSIRDYLVKNGVAADRIMTISKGEEEPVDTGHDEAAWAKNRRVEFKKVVQ